ncbi:plasmid replication, integration and excision activator [Parafrankia colletiae]|uniref:Plasmid replication, integration and excision activator n=1 Tax=Parafrankia colletiae TaxID=573497 RepID=A0A1S1QYA5_9ACTN|nr:plasmid replication, integration and excision activator [Parafrankia colletiae]MCK9899102.1 plasmid replication, integration and excision activator [Frankia sp. Cpl3]OHV38667.1 plasmid replication, integration and excision activator [Parafrankia colletiae]
MAVPRRIPVRFEDVFPAGAFVLGVEPANDYEKVKANAPDPQERDLNTGERVWVVRVLDPDPTARQAELKVKVPGEVQPVLPEAMPGTPFRPVLFEGLTVTPWVDTNGKYPKQGYALRALRLQQVGAARRTGAAA